MSKGITKEAAEKTWRAIERTIRDGASKEYLVVTKPSERELTVRRNAGQAVTRLLRVKLDASIDGLVEGFRLEMSREHPENQQGSDDPLQLGRYYFRLDDDGTVGVVSPASEIDVGPAEAAESILMQFRRF